MPNKPVDLYPEFYNDVFGPIMAPGSSSHMAAPCRAGYMCNSLLGGDEVAEIVVEMDNDGSFKGTFGTMNEDLGMLNGALGHMPDHADFFHVKPWLKEHGIPYRFDFCTMKESAHINSLKFILTGKSGKTATLVANSIGGGMIETVWVNGYAFEGKGDTYVLCIFDAETALDHDLLVQKIEAVLPVMEAGIGMGQKGGVMHWLKINTPLTDGAKAALEGLDYAVLSPVLPVPTTTAKQPQLFKDMVEWRRLAAEQGKGLADVAIDYEMAASGWSREQVVAYMRDTVMPNMYRRTHALYEEDVQPLCTPFTELHYKVWEQGSKNLPLNLGVIGKSIKYVMAGQPPRPRRPQCPRPHGHRRRLPLWRPVGHRRGTGP